MNNYQIAVSRKAYRKCKKLKVPYCPVWIPMNHKEIGFSRSVKSVVDDCVYWHNAYLEDLE